MCVIAVKYFKTVGWVGVKNRDRNYTPSVDIVQSNRKNIQRLYIDDAKTRYTEGLNETGMSIISSSLSVKTDEKEGGKLASSRDDYMSPDGKTIRDALLLKDPVKAAKFLIERELSGFTFVFNKDKCYLLEAGYNVKKDDATENNPRQYKYKLIEVKEPTVRTNHGILIPDIGYSKLADDPYFKRARKSSEERLNISLKELLKIKDPMDMMNALAVSPNKDVFMNPIRTGDPDKKEMVTTGQLLLIPAERTLHYRPINCEIHFKYNKLNGVSAKTFFEVITSKKLLGFKEFVENSLK